MSNEHPNSIPENERFYKARLLPGTYAYYLRFGKNSTGCKFEVRERFLCMGGKGMQAGDTCRYIDHTSPKCTDGSRHVWPALIIYRYYTLNRGWQNYSAKIKLLDGPDEGKIIRTHRITALHGEFARMHQFSRYENGIIYRTMKERR